MTPEKFGPYLLFKKLSEDPIGEVFRAGVQDGDVVGRTVLLRSFNGSAIENRTFVDALSGVTQASSLTPATGRARDLGTVQGVPYATWDYVPGKNLATLLEHIEFGSNPLPPEHALLIAERIALALVGAREASGADTASTHGFLVPHLVMLSNEGETRVLGFEVGPLLRDMVRGNSNLQSHFGRYLRPEVIAGADEVAGEDVYSLAVVLLELLGGRALPPSEPQGYVALVKRIVGSGNEELGTLLQESLTPDANRLTDIATWQQRLSHLMIEGRHKSTTFNLAFFMHSVFRDEIEQEGEEMAHEQRVIAGRDLAASSGRTQTGAEPTPLATGLSATNSEPDALGGGSSEAMATGLPESGSDVLESLEVLDSGLGSPEPPAEPSASDLELSRSGSDAFPIPRDELSSRPTSRRPPVWAGIAAGLMIGALLAYLAYWMWPGAGGVEAAPRTEVSQVDVSPADLSPAAAESAADSTGSPEADAIDPAAEAAAREAEERQQLIEELDQRMAARANEVEASLRSQYSREIAELREQLEESRRREEELRAASADAALDPAVDQEVPAGQGSLPADQSAGSPAELTSADSSASPSDISEPAATLGSEAGLAQPNQTARRASEDTSGDRATAPSNPAGTTEVSDEPSLETAASSTPSPPDQQPTAAAGQQAAQQAVPQRPERVVRGQLVTPGEGVTRPTLLTQIEPTFPDVARRLRREGEVWIDALIGPSGRAEELRVAQSAGFGFDEAAERAVRRARFSAPTKNGVEVRMWTRVRVAFRLE